MLDAQSVTTTATDGFIKKLAARREISASRMQEILGKDNPYPKAKRLIRDIEAVNHAGYELVKADMLALFAELDGDAGEDVSIAEMSRELHDPLQAKIEDMPKADRLRECREGIRVLCDEISAIEREGRNSAETLRRCARGTIDEVNARRNGQR